MAFELFGHRAEFLQINDALRDGLGALIEKHFDATRTTKTYLNSATQVQLDCPYFSIDEDDDAESIQFKSLHNAIAFGIISQNDIQAYVDSRVRNPLSLVKFANNIVENFKNIFEAQAVLYKEFVYIPDHKKALNHFDNTEFVKDFITLQLELLGKVEGIEAPLIAINKLIKYVPSSKAKDFENLINELIAPVYFGEGVTVSLPGNAEDAYQMLQDRFEAVLKDRFVSARNDDLECAVNEKLVSILLT